MIALVITIIVLLILAGVTIVTLTGDNGLLQKAQTAKEQNEEEKELELIKLAVSAAQIEGKGIITTNNLNNELKSNFNNNKEVNEVEEGWNYKSYTILKEGKVERILPKEYQQVEYIESTGTQYINSGIIATTKDCKFDILLEYTKKTGSYGGVAFGSETNSNNWSLNYNGGWFLIGKTNFLNWRYNTNINEKYHFELILKNGSINFNINEEKFEKNYTIGDIDVPIYIFADNINNESINQFSKIRIYKIGYYSYDNIVRNFIPCKSTTTVTNADGVQVPANTKGLYDIVEEKFYTNANTVEDAVDFIAGPEV